MRHRNSGFTLIELLVVLGLITIISSISFGAFRSVSDGNKRTTCQSNMSQIFKSVRLYSQDFDGKYPYLNPLKVNAPDPATPTDYVAEASPATPAGGIGLWALYTFRIEGDDLICSKNDVNLPLANIDLQNSIPASNGGLEVGLSGYVRSPKIFHCPADRFEKFVQYRETPGAAACVITPIKVANAQFTFEDATGQKRLNPGYLSYQFDSQNDRGVAPFPSGLEPALTYSSFRAADTAGNRVRQLSSFTTPGINGNPTAIVDRPINATTVLTWCRFHRNLDDKTDSLGQTVAGKRNFDNVLFSDGRVQSLPAVQDVNEPNGVSPEKCTGWQRVPRENAESMRDSSTCTP